MRQNFKLSIPLAVVITMLAVIYQRSTGPTYPKKVTIVLGSQEVKIKLPRSHGGESDCPVEIPLLEKDMRAMLHYKRFPTNDPWTMTMFAPEENRLVAKLPNQPPAGKLQYAIQYQGSGELLELVAKEAPVVIRFKGDVPTWILFPHIFLMFAAMFLSSITAIEAVKKTESIRTLSRVTLGCLLLGGMVLGPIVQKYAFGVYWAGIPFGWDLTDNKLLFGVLAWVVAVGLNWKKSRPSAIVLAGVVLLLMYSIPHSTMGSQYNYDKGVVETKTD